MTRDRERRRQKYHKKEVGNVKAIQIEALRKLDSIELKVLETAAEQLGGNVARLGLYGDRPRGGNVAPGGQL